MIRWGVERASVTGFIGRVSRSKGGEHLSLAETSQATAWRRERAELHGDPGRRQVNTSNQNARLSCKTRMRRGAADRPVGGLRASPRSTCGSKNDKSNQLAIMAVVSTLERQSRGLFIWVREPKTRQPEPISPFPAHKRVRNLIARSWDYVSVHGKGVSRRW